MGHEEAIIFEKTYGVLTPDLRQMCVDMVYRGVNVTAMECIAARFANLQKHRKELVIGIGNQALEESNNLISGS